jgi:hypothetical protein
MKMLVSPTMFLDKVYRHVVGGFERIRSNGVLALSAYVAEKLNSSARNVQSFAVNSGSVSSCMPVAERTRRVRKPRSIAHSALSKRT